MNAIFVYKHERALCNRKSLKNNNLRKIESFKCNSYAGAEEKE